MTTDKQATDKQFKDEKAKLSPKHQELVDLVDKRVEAGDIRGAIQQTLANARKMLDDADAAIAAATTAEQFKAAAENALDEFEAALKFLHQHKHRLLMG